MYELTPESIKQFFEKSAEANKAAWESQTAYFESLIKRNSDCFKGLGEAQVAALKEMAEAQTFNQAFESHLAYEEKVREDLAALQDESVKAWEALLGELKAIYTPAEPEKLAKPVKTAKATKAKKAA
ncbi:MAG: hypothetical protein HKO88_08880 [Xanthomonadales bacterium]|nr:hypothetical protein [Xanthomonadales bacterium]